MAQVSVRGISKYFGTLKALDNVSCEFEDGKFYALLGPSGSGKTTLLRMIAGFEFANAGTIFIDGEAVDTLPVEKRDIGMVFQNYALFPNMNVFDNVGFGLSVRGTDKGEITRRVGAVLELVKLTGLDKRRPHQLSGGQRQRVAVARALVTNPRVLLLDEPLSALDRTLRVEMEVELRRIQRDVGITTIFVTHDQEEALTMSDHIGILDKGHMVQEGPPLDVYENPNSVFSARFLGESNLLRGTVRNGDLVLGDGTVVTCRASANGGTGGSGEGPGVCSVRPEKITLSSDPDNHTDTDATPRNHLRGTVIRHIFAGSSLTYQIQWNGDVLRVFMQNLSGDILPAGTPVSLSWKPGDTVMVPDA